VLAGAVSANQPEVHVSYRDWTAENQPARPEMSRTALNSASDVTILASPTISPRREVLWIALYNKDTASVTLTLKTDDGTTERIIAKKVLATLETLHWSRESGLYVTNA
jgi:hypothetical protein